uniref:Helicase C-terminal domain-containing protein n=1 Tax=Ditylenchus dipsaci TaxID=166011 RepID=A0A915DVE4_9BILA
MGFAEQLHDVLKHFAKAGLSEPTLVRLDLETKLSEKLKMMFVTCRLSEKLNALLFLCRWAVQTRQQTIVFCATMKHVEYSVGSTARKQNIGRFRANECYLLVVTDVAARGVDIPLLDVAINFHFPPKPKLYVHRVGRVARAGKPGVAFSLVTPDELPYLVDMFLFLGRPMNFAGVESKQHQYSNDDDVIIGRFPETLAHLETEFLRNIHDTSIEISDLLHKSENAMKKYSRTRAQPSSESVRRVKQELRMVSADVHPFFNQFEEQGKDPSGEKDMLQGISNWRPNATIFEIGAGGKQQPAAIMKEKRKQHQEFIDGKRKAAEKASSLCYEEVEKAKNGTTKDAIGNNEEICLNNSEQIKEDCEKEIAETFGDVVTISSFISASNSNLPSVDRKKQKRKLNSDHERKQEEKRVHFMDYLPKDANTERGLAVEKMGAGTDDDKGMYREQKQKRWDQGTLLPATYKAGRYENWQKQQKVSFRDNEGDGEEDDSRRSRFRGGQSGRGRGGSRGSGRGGFQDRGSRQPRSELKNADQIMKTRRERAKKQTIRLIDRRECREKTVRQFPISRRLKRKFLISRRFERRFPARGGSRGGFPARGGPRGDFTSGRDGFSGGNRGRGSSRGSRGSFGGGRGFGSSRGGNRGGGQRGGRRGGRMH